MPMFDDPGKRLRQLQEELLAVEEDPDEELEEPEDYLDEDYEEFEDYDDYEEAPPIRRHNYGVAYADELLELEEDDSVFYREEYELLRKKRRRKLRRLTVLAVVELLAILGMLGWWLSWIR